MYAHPNYPRVSQEHLKANRMNSNSQGHHQTNLNGTRGLLGNFLNNCAEHFHICPKENESFMISNMLTDVHTFLPKEKIEVNNF